MAAVGLRCTVCVHGQRAAIDRAIVGGASDRVIASTYALARSSVQRHKAAHIKRAVERAGRAAVVKEALAGASTIDQVRDLTGRMLALLEVAEGDRDEQGRLRKLPGLDASGKVAVPADVKAAAAAGREARALLALTAELLGEVTKGTTINLFVDAKGKPRPEWVELQRVLWAALRPYPEAARAVAEAFAGAAALPVLEAAS